ncbi:hypothetical protein LTR53_008916 [Teratosphaeriaceae sp. CCFEE 6253]|nr:hypothetical protein LTR53_008916 [Teratosphaeriaceae sp. CCFEE 6253]
MYGGKTSVISLPHEDEIKASPTVVSAWVIPTEVALSADGTVNFVSYINNLHPQKHMDTYEVIERVIAQIVPMFNSALTSMRHKRRPCRIKGPASSAVADYGKAYFGIDYYAGRPWGFTSHWDQMGYLWNTRPLMQPDPGSYQDRSHPHDFPVQAEAAARAATDFCTCPQEPAPIDPKTVDLFRDFPGQNLQIIVKMTSVYLTRDRPSCEGEWCVDGQLNEHICASASYHYDCENVTDSSLAFRESMDRNHLNGLYRQFEWQPVLDLFGFESGGSATQEVGEVLAKEGRIIVYPNVLQHRCQTFQLKDATKPGHHKILTLFLVDPNVRIPSTAHVPPQQKHWWSETVLGLD